MRTFVMQVTLADLGADGRPPLPARLKLDRPVPGTWAIYDSQTDGFAMLSRIGTRNGDPVFLGVTNAPRIAAVLDGIGKLAWLKDIIAANGAAWTWLKAQPLRFIRRAGSIVGIVPPVVPAGVGALAGLDTTNGDNVTVDP